MDVIDMKKTDETSVKELPSKVDRADLLELLLINEKIGRLEASIGNHQLQIGALQKEIKEAGQEREMLSKAFNGKYSIGEKDSVNTKTGEIARSK